MLRKSDSPDAEFAFIGVSSTSIITCSRSKEAGSTLAEHDLPISVRIKTVFFRFQQIDNHICSSFSFDAKNWVNSDTNSISADGKTLMGIAICSGKKLNKIIAQFGGMMPFASQVKSTSGK